MARERYREIVTACSQSRTKAKFGPGKGRYEPLRLTASPAGDRLQQVEGRNTEGQLLTRIILTYTFEETGRLEVPADGVRILAARGYPASPRDWSFTSVDISYEGSQRVSGD